MMFTPYADAFAKAKNYDAGLTAYDFHPHSSVLVFHEEGTQLFFRSAFLRKWKDYIIIFTEHHKFHVYHRTDLHAYYQFEEKSVASLPDMDSYDICSVCTKEFLVDFLVYDPLPGDLDFDNIVPCCNSCLQIKKEENEYVE